MREGRLFCSGRGPAESPPGQHGCLLLADPREGCKPSKKISEPFMLKRFWSGGKKTDPTQLFNAGRRAGSYFQGQMQWLCCRCSWRGSICCCESHLTHGGIVQNLKKVFSLPQSSQGLPVDWGCLWFSYNIYFVDK